MELLHLPLDILRLVLETALVRNGLDDLIRLRLVCREQICEALYTVADKPLGTLDIEILKAIVATKALNSPDYEHRYFGHRLYSEHLLARTLADHKREHHLSSVIVDTVNYILERTGGDDTRREDYMRSLCMSMVQNCESWEVARIINPAYCFTSNPVPERQCTLEENTLAAVAHLGPTPLFWQLLDEGVQDAATYFGHPLGCAARRGDYGMTQALLEKGLRYTRSGFATVPDQGLGGTAYNGHERVMKLLLEPKYRNEYAPIDLEYAIRRAAAGGHHGIIELLLAQDRLVRSLTPAVIQNRILMSAALNGQERIARTALDNGADPNDANSPHMKWGSVLDGAVKWGYEDIVKLLLARGAKLYPRRKANPLFQAARGGWIRIARILIAHGADVNPRRTIIDPYPLSPLLVAIEYSNVEMVKLLFENGASLDDSGIRSKACSLAHSKGCSEIQKILTKHRDWSAQEKKFVGL